MKSFEGKYGGCPMYYTMSIIGGKWNWVILWEIYEAKVIRYNKLKAKLEPIAHKMLSKQLKDLESNNLIHREQYNEIPPKVEYSLTNAGRELIPILIAMFKWGEKYKDK